MTSICVLYYHRLPDDLEKIFWWWHRKRGCLSPKVFLWPTATPDNWLLKLWSDCCRDGVLLHFNVSSCRNHGPGCGSSPGFSAAIRRYVGPNPGAAAEVNGASAPVSHHARLFPVKLTRRSSGDQTRGRVTRARPRLSHHTDWRMTHGKAEWPDQVRDDGARTQEEYGTTISSPRVYAGHPGWEARGGGCWGALFTPESRGEIVNTDQTLTLTFFLLRRQVTGTRSSQASVTRLNN